MENVKNRDAVLDFLDYLERKGLMASATVQARRVAVNKILGILDPAEARDVLAVDLDAIFQRFQNLHGKDFTPVSLRTYQSRLKSALADFASYLENPLAFKPAIQGRERKSLVPKRANEGDKVQQTPIEVARSYPAPDEGPMAVSILPIPIRADLTVFIQGLPFNLSEVEAKKIAAVVMAMATIA